MSELVPFKDPREDDPYYTQKVWFGSQPESGGLTQDELDTLAEVWRASPEVDEHRVLTPAEMNRLRFAEWYRLNRGNPDDDLPPAA